MLQLTINKDLDNNRLILEYTVNLSTADVWKAYSDRQTFEKWWGPQGWQTTTKQFDFKSDGCVHYGMTCIDKNQQEWFGQTAWGVMKIQEIKDKTSIVYQDFFSDENGTLNHHLPALMITNEFTAEDDTTRVTSTCVATSASQIEELITMGMIEGFTSQLEKLEQLSTIS